MIALLILTIGCVYALPRTSDPPADSIIWESLFKSSLDPQRARQSLKYLTSTTHVAGSKSDHEQSLWMMEQFKSFGIPQVETSEYWPLLNFPVSRSLSLIEPIVFDAPLTEKAIDEDPDSWNESIVPSFFGYSPSGNVTAPIVFANFGTPRDFELLSQAGINVRGKIVLVKYGNAFRGLKVRAAELAGAAAVLVYSDPLQDGLNRGNVYPGMLYFQSSDYYIDGPYRPETSIQRGSIHYPSFYPGDPLTPGQPALKNATRLPQDEAPALPKIPALPISYADAEPVFS